jgi:predicted Zn-dependent protease
MRRPHAIRPARRPLAGALALALTLASGPNPADPLRLPEIGSTADSVMTSGAEVRLGKAFMRQVRKAVPVSDDPMVTDYLGTLGRQLVAADGTAGGSFDFFLIDQPAVNAFAGPGGHIGVYSGLVQACETENELAAVMAHEIAHVTQRHLMRTIEDQGKYSIPATALMIAAAILGAQISPNAGMAALAGIAGMAAQHQVNFTRENEKEADRIGIATLAAAGRDPYAMAGFFERLSRSTQVSENDVPELLRDHPVNSARIADALGRADEYGARQRPDSLRFQLTRAALRAHSYNSPQKAVEDFAASLKQGRYANETAERYGYALALLHAGRLPEAKSESARLVAAQPNVAEFTVLDAQVDLKQGNGAQAIAHLKEAVDLSSGNWALRTAYGEALLEAGDPRRAMDELKQVARRRPDDAGLYELLSQAAIKAKDKAATFRYRAEKLYAQGDLEPAIKQLEFALRQHDLPYQDAAEIQVLLEGYKAERKEEKENKGPLG